MPGGIPCRYGLTCAGGLHGSRKRWRKRLVAYQRVRTAYTNFALRVRHVRERVDHYLSPAVVADVLSGFDVLERGLRA